MNKKQIRVLIPLGLLLLSLVVLAGCRPSTALTDLVNALNALNPSTETTETEEEQEEDEASELMDPIDEERDDAKIEEMDILIGRLLEDMDEEEAEEAIRNLYDNIADSHEWGIQEYNPELLNDEYETGALALYIWDHNIRLESGRASDTGTVLSGTGVEGAEGVASSSGTLQSSRVPVTPDDDADDADEEEKGGRDDPDAIGEGVDADSSRTDPNSDGTDTGDADSDNRSDPEDEKVNEDRTQEEVPDQDQNEDEGQEEDQGRIVFESHSGHNIAATGQAAIMVCMLGGADRLVATSPDFASNDLAQRAFNSSGQMHYATLWNGLSTDDGSQPMNDTEFNYLLNEVQPDLVLEMAGSSTFSNAQLRQMAERGIGYYPLSNMYSIDTMKSVTKSLAEIMDESEEGDPAYQIYEVYRDWVNAEVDMATSCSMNVRETIFIDDWDENVLTEFAVKEYVEGGYDDDGYLSWWMPTGEYVTAAQGAAVIRIGQHFHPMTSCLTAVNVYDWSASPHTRSKTQNQLNSTDYGYGTGYIDGSEEWFEFTQRDGTTLFETKSGDYCYVTPIYNRLNGTTYTPNNNGTREPYDHQYKEGGLSFINGREGIGVIMDSFYDVYGKYYAPHDLSYGKICLGYSDAVSTWSTVIVKSQYIGEQLSRNSAWQTNGSTGGVYSTSTDNHERTTTYYYTSWTLNNATSSYVYDMSYDTSIGGDYEVIVNPTGVGDWTGQSPEAILETVWAGWALHQGYDDSPYMEVYMTSRIKDFYKTFYGLDLNLSENQDILSTILAGPEK